MRKYGRWMLALGIMAVSPAVSNAQYVGQRAVAGRYAAQPSGANYNQQMAEQIAGALRKAQLRGYDVEIEFKGGVAVLAGKVKDEANRQAATKAVSALQGVTKVDNRLQVLEAVQAKPIIAPPPPMEAPAMTAPQMPAPQMPAPSMQAAYQGPPTQPVSQTQFTPAAPSNQKVAESIASALSSAGLQGYDVDIRFQDGTAVLAGTVGTPQQRAMAAQLTQQIPGVQTVSNQLRLQQMQPASPIQRTAYDGAPTPPVTAPPRMAAAPRMAAPSMPMPAPSMAGPSPMPGGFGGATYGSPNLPDYAWPSYAQYPNSAAISYPTQYSASAWPYIGPYYPYPQVPLGWRQATLECDDGHWQLSFNKKTDKWFWFLKPGNWGDN